MNRFKRWAAMALAGLAVASMTGCASFEYTKPAPAQQQAVKVKLSGEDLSGMTDLPIGTYRIPESQVILSGHQKGQAAGMLFGLIGVAITHAVNADAGAKAVKDTEDILRIKLNEPLMAEVNRAIAQAPLNTKFTAAGDAGAPELLLTPGLVLTYLNDADVRPFVVIKASLAGADKKPIWTTRYIASTGLSRPLAGEGSWTAENGAALKSTMQASIEQAVRVMLTDVSSPYQRDENAMSTVEGQFPFMKQRLQMKGYKLTEDDRYLAFIPKLGDVLVFAGVNVLDKQDALSREAAKDDAPLKVIDPKVAGSANASAH